MAHSSGSVPAHNRSDERVYGSMPSAMALNQWRLMAPALDVSQVQEAQPEAPCLAGLRQADKEIGDLIILRVSYGAIAKTGLAHPEGPAGQRYADTACRHCVPGQRPARRWPRYFFDKASRSRSACMLTSANMRFKRRFPSSGKQSPGLFSDPPLPR